MDVLWMSNAPWAGTGYGVQSKLMLRELNRLGHKAECFAFYGLEGGTIEYDGYKVWPSSGIDDFGNDVIEMHLRRGKQQALITLMDLFVLNMEVWSRLQKQICPWIAWTPVDHEEIGGNTLQRLEIVKYPVAMSQFGADQMKRAGVESFACIPHAVDTSVFKPLADAKDRDDIRRAMSMDPDEYIIGMVMANKGDRKQLPQQFRAIRQWMNEHPELKTKVFLYTDPTSALGGWDIPDLLYKTGLKGHAYGVNQYETTVVPGSPELMAQLYQCMDVLVNVSSGEGFGVPIIEAQACGIPVVTGAWTSMPEITNYGYTVEPVNMMLGAHFGWQFHLNVEDMAYKLECVYRKMPDEEWRAQAVKWVHETFCVEAVGEMWNQALKEVAEAEDQAPVLVNRSAVLTDDHRIVTARKAMEQEAVEYGTYLQRVPEYALIYKTLKGLGLQDEDRIIDLGAAWGDLGRFMTQQHWHGVYVPVDMTIDGTNLEMYVVPEGYDWIICQQTIEHIHDWELLLRRCENRARATIITTPNGEVVGEHEKEDYPHQMAHVHWFKPSDFEEKGFEVSLHSFTGRQDDTILAVKRGRSEST